MLIIGIDFESNGTDQAELKITEVGAILYDTETKEAVEEYSALVWDESYPPQPEMIVELTGISDNMLKADGVSPMKALALLSAMMLKAEYAVAYNKVFDENVYLGQCKAYDIHPAHLPWICAYTEVPYAEKYRCRQLSHLAFDHGLKMDHRDLHRATDDVRLMLELLDLYPWQGILAYAKEPWVFVQAIIPAPWTDGGKGKADATKRGYGWERARGTDAPVFPKQWVKRIKEGQLTKETAESPFRIVKLTR